MVQGFSVIGSYDLYPHSLDKFVAAIGGKVHLGTRHGIDPYLPHVLAKPFEAKHDVAAVR
ncbi:hypothetical protein D3C72_2224870 [compost metagenome]